MTTDHLVSPRVVTDAEGEVIARRDFMPFGEDLGAGVGPRTENLKYSAFGTDRVRQRFTGYEKDGETGLDFAEARMYQNKHGRFTAPDPLLASASAANPQTFNRYIYTGNNPVNITDPSGLNWCQNRNTNIATWVGSGVACDSDSFAITNSTRTVGASGCFVGVNTGCYEQGYQVSFNGNGTTNLVISGPVVDSGESYTVETVDQTASQEIASASASELGTTMNQRPVSEVSLGCPVSVPSCSSSSSSSSSGYQRLDTANASKPNTVKGIEIVVETCAAAGAVPCNVLDAALKLGSGDIEQLPYALPGLSLIKKAKRGADVARDGLTNAQLIQKSATIAERVIGGRGPVSGIAKHQRATALLNRYQSIYGNRGISTNVYFNNGNGNRGFLDVLDRTNGTIYDFKFGKARMSRAQYNKYSRNFGLPIEIIRP